MEPTKQQSEAINAVLTAWNAGQTETVLVGPAGCGKTTCMRWLIGHLVKEGLDVTLGAPTGKAAARLQELTGMDASTMHRLLYAHVETEGEGEAQRLVFGEPHAPCPDGGVVIIDEASMVGSVLHNDFMSEVPLSSLVLWVGDREQLEPVNDTWGPRLDRPTAALTEVHRQALDNPLLAYATAVRTGTLGEFKRTHKSSDERLTMSDGSLDAAVAWACERYRAGIDATVLTYTHRVREAVIGLTRKALGMSDGIVVGDRLLCKMNSHHLGMMNGETLEVVGARKGRAIGLDVWMVDTRCGKQFSIPDVLLNERDPWPLRRDIGREAWQQHNLMAAWHGQCLTVHVSQGSQWDDVCFVGCQTLARSSRTEPDQARRLVYTAATRAATNLHVMRLR